MPLHTKYRPSSLDTVIGHDMVVTRLKGVINSGNVPSAMMFTGPTSVGKTTLARAFACDLSGMGTNFLRSNDYLEINFSDTRGIDDIRAIQNRCQFMPQLAKYRVIIGDEAQGLLSSNAAANCFLKLLEDVKRTVFILCSMNPEKFKTTTLGKALANRCVQFSLEPPNNASLLKQAKRICKGEKMGYMNDPDGKLLKKVVLNSNSEMRTLAQILEACQQYYNGLDEKPQYLELDDITTVLSSTEAADDQVAYDFLLAVYSLQFARAQTAILNASDYIGMVNRLMYINAYLVNSTIIKERHPKIWHTQKNKALKKELEKAKVTLGQLAEVNTRLVELKDKTMNFSVGCDSLLSAFAYSTIRKLQEMRQA